MRRISCLLYKLAGLLTFKVAPESCIVTPASSNKLACLYAGL